MTELEKAMTLRHGGDAFDWFVLAMAHHRLGHADEVPRWYDKAVGWMEKNKAGDAELIRFREEAKGLLEAP
ncbi:MAG TPA: hypothetical protein VKA46_17820 [Gemmataceae bacterium]|nr:hypothetical protein [Gemmataceae bacterium]